MAGWRRYLGPAAFLLAATIAVLLVRSGLQAGSHGASPPPAPTSVLRTNASTTTISTIVTKPKAPAKRYWTVRAGDTFAVISAQTGVPVATIEQLNPTVKSTSLFIGEKLRIR
jgi:LysM repeat protein